MKNRSRAGPSGQKRSTTLTLPLTPNCISTGCSTRATTQRGSLRQQCSASQNSILTSQCQPSTRREIDVKRGHATRRIGPTSWPVALIQYTPLAGPGVDTLRGSRPRFVCRPGLRIGPTSPVLALGGGFGSAAQVHRYTATCLAVLADGRDGSRAHLSVKCLCVSGAVRAEKGGPLGRAVPAVGGAHQPSSAPGRSSTPAARRRSATSMRRGWLALPASQSRQAG